MVDPVRMIRVVVADDSPIICRLIKHYLESDPGIRVVSIASNGVEAVEATRKHRPDVVTLDLNMPVLDGLGALEEILAAQSVPIILISGVSREAALMTEKGLRLGAVDFIFKYSSSAAISPDALRREIIGKVKAAARIRVVRPAIKRTKAARDNDAARMKNKIVPTLERGNDTKMLERGNDTKTGIKQGKTIGLHLFGSAHVVVVGASTGGPLALKEMLGVLRNGFSFPLVIVQHMPVGFTNILADQFNRSFPFAVREAQDGDRMVKGEVLIAPGNRHLLITGNGAVELSDGAPVHGHRPSIDVTMQTAAHIFGNRVTGVILSGMGEDGAEGMAAIAANRGKTFAQSKGTCVIDSMPLSAINKDAVRQIGSPAQIGRWLVEDREIQGEIDE